MGQALGQGEVKVRSIPGLRGVFGQLRSALTRLLVNLSRHPRHFLYWLDDRWRLTELGVNYGRREFRPLVLPEQTQLREVVLPGRTDHSVHGLRFLASAIPHVGLNDPPEHFLISFEA